MPDCDNLFLALKTNQSPRPEAKVSFKDQVRKRIEDLKAHEQAIWNTVRSRSKDYREALGLSADDLEVLRRSSQKIVLYPRFELLTPSSFLSVVHVDGEKFEMFISHANGFVYGGSWETLMMATCTTREELNFAVGYGSTFLTILRSEYHEWIIATLAND